MYYWRYDLLQVVWSARGSDVTIANVEGLSYQVHELA